MMESKLFADMPSPPVAPRLPREFMDPHRWTPNHLWGGLAILVIAVLSFGFATHYYFPYNYMEICAMFKDFFTCAIASVYYGILNAIYYVIENIKSLIMTGVRQVTGLFS